MSAISISSDDSQDAIIVEDVKQEVLVSFASLESIKNEPGELVSCSYTLEGSENENIEDYFDNGLQKIEYILPNISLAYGTCQEESILPDIDCTTSEKNSRRVEILAKKLAEALETIQPSTSQTEECSSNSYSMPVHNTLLNEQNVIDGSVHNSLEECCSFAAVDDVPLSTEVINEDLITGGQVSLTSNIEKTIYDVSTGNYSFEANSRKKNTFKKGKNVRNINKRTTKGKTHDINSNLNNVDEYCESTQASLNKRIQHTANNSNCDMRDNDQVTNKMIQRDQNNQRDKPDRRKRKYNKLSSTKVKNDLSKIKKLMKTCDQVNAAINKLNSEFELMKTNKTALRESSVSTKHRPVYDNLSSPINLLDNQPTFGNKMKFSRNKDTGQISVSLISPTSAKPMVACKPIQRDISCNLNNTVISKSDPHEAQEKVISPSGVGVKSTSNNVSVSTTDPNLVQHSKQDLLHSMKDKNFRETFVKCYNIVFDDNGEFICKRMADLLLLSIKEYREYTKRLKNARKLHSKQLKLNESAFAQKNYSDITKKYMYSFEELFMKIHSKIFKSLVSFGIDQCKPLLIAWFLKIFLKVSNVFPELSDCLEEVKNHIINELFRNLRQKIPEILENFTENSTNFKQDCWTVLELMKDCFNEVEESSNDGTAEAQEDLPLQSNIFEADTEIESIEQSNEAMVNTCITLPNNSMELFSPDIATSNTKMSTDFLVCNEPQSLLNTPVGYPKDNSEIPYRKNNDPIVYDTYTIEDPLSAPIVQTSKLDNSIHGKQISNHPKFQASSKSQHQLETDRGPNNLDYIEISSSHPQHLSYQKKSFESTRTRQPRLNTNRNNGINPEALKCPNIPLINTKPARKCSNIKKSKYPRRNGGIKNMEKCKPNTTLGTSRIADIPVDMQILNHSREQVYNVNQHSELLEDAERSFELSLSTIKPLHQGSRELSTVSLTNENSKVENWNRYTLPSTGNIPEAPLDEMPNKASIYERLIQNTHPSVTLLPIPNKSRSS